MYSRIAKISGKGRATLALFAPKAGQYGLFAATYGLALMHHLRAPVAVWWWRRRRRTHREPPPRRYDAPRASKRVFAFEPVMVKARDLPAGFASTLPELPFDGVPVRWCAKALLAMHQSRP